jgi:hypothetical protein
MRFKRVCRWSRGERLFRVARWTWERGRVGDGRGYGAKFSLAFRPALFQFRRELDGWLFTVLGVRLHYARSYGGRFG